jgi:Tol biopolymer transport system component
MDLADKLGSRERLEWEARAASALNHPNIVTIYDVGNEHGLFYIVSELVAGEPLHQLIRRGPLPIARSIEIAIQIADALAAAHFASIVHRDLKPANIMVNAVGSGVWRVKLLDFGLARQIRLAKAAGSDDAVTITTSGTLMGTVGYMSPEQVRGEPEDHRSDIFSFGVVLYEMLTGRRAFKRESTVETLHCILKDDPPQLSEIGRQIPFALESIVRHCLEKGPNERFQSAWDLAFALEAISAASQRVAVGPPTRISKGLRIVLLALGCFVLGCLTTLFVLDVGVGIRKQHVAVNTVTFAQVTDDPGPELYPSLSPDGKSVAYASRMSGNWNIYVRSLGARDSVNLTKSSTLDDTQPAFSPDGQWISFRSERDEGGIYIMRAHGESVKRLSQAGFNPAWSPDGKEILCADESILRPEDRQSPTSRLWSIQVSTGEKRLIWKGDAVQPQWSPHGHRIAYWAIDKAGHRDIWTIPARGGQPVPVTHDEYVDWNPVWSPDGRYLYFSSDRGGMMAIWRVPIQETSGKVLGAPESIPAPSLYIGQLNFSRDGTRLAYVTQSLESSVQRVLFDPTSETVLDEPKELKEPLKSAARPALSPDGQWLAFNSWERQEDLFVVKTNGDRLRQLTNDAYKNRGPRWSPDGKRIAFFSKRSGNWEIWTIHPDGTGLKQITKLSGASTLWPVWSPDGKSLAYTVFGLNSFLMDPTKSWDGQMPKPLPAFSEHGHLYSVWSWSPNGQSVAGFEQREDGGYAGIVVYSPSSRTFEKLTDFGADPVWLSDSQRLLFLNEGKIHLVDRQSRRTREVLSIAPHEIAGRGFAISRDDRQIYFSVSSLEADVWLMNLSD